MLLITAFAPFDGTGLNSSLEALRLFASDGEREIDGVRVRAVALPAAYDEAVDAIEAHLDGARAIVHLGQGRAGDVGIERQAVNRKLLNFDEARAGGERKHGPIFASEDAPQVLWATVPVDGIVRALVAAGVPTRASDDAGTFYCNHILFRSLHRAAKMSNPPLVGFVHLPRLPEQAQVLGGGFETLPLEVLARAVEVVAQTLAGKQEA